MRIHKHALRLATRRAFIEAAASVADGFVKAADKDPGYRPQWPEQGEGWR